MDMDRSKGSASRRSFRQIIGGESVPALSGGEIEVVCPSDGAAFATILDSLLLTVTSAGCVLLMGIPKSFCGAIAVGITAFVRVTSMAAPGSRGQCVVTA